MLRCLAVLGEQNVTQLADATQRPQFAVSANLKVLATSNLVWRRRSGSFVYYRLPEESSRPTLCAVVGVLRRLYADTPPRSPQTVSLASREDSPEWSDAALTTWFRAFTHPRRLQITRLVHTHKAAAVPLLTRTLGMSHSACWRHLSTLQDRGILSIRDRDGVPTALAVRCSDSRRQRILLAVLDTLKPSDR